MSQTVAMAKGKQRRARAAANVAAQERRWAARQARRRRITIWVAALLALSFLASTVGALIVAR